MKLSKQKSKKEDPLTLKKKITFILSNLITYFDMGTDLKYVYDNLTAKEK